MRHIENMLGATLDEMTSVLWSLKQKGHVMSDEKSSLQVTVEGMDYLEANRPSPEVVMPLIKPTAIAGIRLPPAAPPVHVTPGEDLARKNVLDRILARNPN